MCLCLYKNDLLQQFLHILMVKEKLQLRVLQNASFFWRLPFGLRFVKVAFTKSKLCWYWMVIQSSTRFSWSYNKTRLIKVITAKQTMFSWSPIFSFHCMYRTHFDNRFGFLWGNLWNDIPEEPFLAVQLIAEQDPTILNMHVCVHMLALIKSFVKKLQSTYLKNWLSGNIQCIST